MNSSKTILHTEAATGFGGQQIRILNELTGLKHKGYRMLLAAPESSEIFREANKLNVDTFPIPFTRNAFFSSIFKILRIIKEEQVDIVSTHSSRDSWPASLAARISSKKPKLVRTRHMSHPIRPTFYNRFLYASLPHKIVSTGEAIKTELHKTLQVSLDKLISIPSGIDLDRFDRTKYNRAAFRQKLKVKENEVVIAVIALLIAYKGHQYLVDAIEKIRNTHPYIKVWFIGDGPLSDTLEQMIVTKHLEKQIQQLGFRDNIPEILAATDITVLPSIGTEGVPQVLTQATAMELPIIATNVGAVSEIVQDGVNGYLIPPKDSDALAIKIVELAVNPELRRQLGLAGRKIALARFSLTQMLDNIESVYQG